ncbi:MAG: PepSY-associated TM helix domain-containing protein [Trueperaceae bacterium]
MLHTPTSTEAAQEGSANKFYLATWRWHFYAGIYVIPFMIMLSLTGLVMLYHNQIEAAQYKDRIFVTPAAQTLPLETQLQTVRAAYPEATISEYIPATSADRSNQFSVTTKDELNLAVFVNPYNGEILGEVNQDKTWNATANTIHGTFLLGDSGDRLIEIAAGLAIMLVITGLYLWWPRNKQGMYGTLIPRFNVGKRIAWRDLHSSVGFYIALGLVFFMISGMSWTGIWGEKYVQAWNTFPPEKWNNVPLSDDTHAEMNHTAVEEVPWNLEQTPLPASGSMAGADGLPMGMPVNLDSLSAFAEDNGFAGFRIALPADETGVYTISADTMSGDVTDARQDRTVHIDQYTGKKLADVDWGDYSLMAKGMAAGVALHQGDMGWWNKILNTLFCLACIFISVSGIVMWWLRRPQGALRLAAPPMPKNMPLWKGAVFIMLVVSLAFPLVGITLITVLALDLLVLSRIPALKSVFN